MYIDIFIKDCGRYQQICICDSQATKNENEIAIYNPWGITPYAKHSFFVFLAIYV